MSNEIMVSNESGIEANGLVSTIKLDSVENRMRVAHACNDSESLASIGDRVIEVVDIFQTTGVRKSRQAGIPDSECINTYIICKDGTCYMSQSAGIAQSAAIYAGLIPGLGHATGDGYIPMRVEEKLLANGNTVKRLVDVL